VTLTNGVKRIDVKTVFDNKANDHRLRVLFHTGIDTDLSCAESVFDVVERGIPTLDCRDWKEPMPVTHPQKSFVSLAGSSHASHDHDEDDECDGDETAGFTVINKGLPEYEVIDNDSRTIALTLLRAFGQGVRSGEGLQVAGQDQGQHIFEYAFCPHVGDWEESQVWQVAHGFNTPLITAQSSIHAGALPIEMSFVELRAENFPVTAIKKADKSDAVILRGYNIGSEMEAVRAKVFGCAKPAVVALDEDFEEGVTPGVAYQKQILSQSFQRIP